MPVGSRIVFGRFDHVGMIVDDLDRAVARARETFGLEIARTGPIAQFDIDAVFLGEGFGTLELFLFTDPQLQSGRLEGAPQRLDHVAYEVDDIDAVSAALRATGVRFVGPDRREELTEPFAIGTARMLWTLPDSSAGLALQLIERSR
jgi:catechol 2,3-dioxygenase-like lactoylglutathione lyase family enzyme